MLNELSFRIHIFILEPDAQTLFEQKSHEVLRDLLLFTDIAVSGKAKGWTGFETEKGTKTAEALGFPCSFIRPVLNCYLRDMLSKKIYINMA